MADISKCENEECPSKLQCYRYTVEANEYWQTYADFEVKEGEDKCEYFWDNKNC